MAKPRRGDTVELVIDDLAFGGEGVGRASGYVVFVRGGIPGDRVRVRITETRARFGRAVIESVDVPSPDRVAAPCAYFGRCGGCRLQHVAYPAQLALKEKQVRDCLERLGEVTGFELRPILPAPEPYGYRNKMEFTVVAAPGGARLGLHEADRYDVVLDIERCLLQSDTMNALLAEVREQARGLSVYDPDSGQGLLRFVTLREGRRTREAMVNFVAAAPDVETLGPVAERLRARVPETASVVLNVNSKKASVAVGTEEHGLVGGDSITERLGGLIFHVSASSFFQTNTVQAERLFGVVEAACELAGSETVVDLYSGTGAISLLLARRCRRVWGVEVAPAAVADAVRNAQANGIDNCTFLSGEVRHVLPELVRQGVSAEVVVADPPRAGFHPKALGALADLGPARIVYVSCNPSTLARDVGDLARRGYRLEWVQPVDMFPQTPHIEAVARLRRAA
ncbi:MAG: 23S rRNA (uracil(1939)-C(5))-methyltransferase RlmD [Candidatus Rokubacteria bacterium]|nr:23S rRNA (uracil(1939)-C(5))-methyltransferase RlmD [Candidatus Rokubacteria bacterium]MBI3827017.1 23S rRNA (uracil(1939)-C(5))-methyltransferase RlmD [Candidatus Rokubacteria bacterium]